MYGLDKEALEQLNCVFSAIKPIDKVMLYGSRAMGSYKNGSDIDISLEADNLTLKTVYELEELIFELYLPYMFDISIFEQISNEALCSHIREKGCVLYDRSKNQR